jgi:hypothetical protein
MNWRYIMLLLAVCAVTGCSKCQDETGVGHAESGVFVTCDRTGYTVRNAGAEETYLNISEPCLLDTSKIPPVGPHGELSESVVVHGSGVARTTPFGAVLGRGASTRHDIDVSVVDICDDYTHAPPGQHERGPTPLAADRNAVDALLLHLHVTSTAATRSLDDVKVVCPLGP